MKPAKPTKPSVDEPVKKRHRRTKAELLQDPEYCEKHGLPKPGDDQQAEQKPARRNKARTNRVDALEAEYLPKLYTAWKKVQSLTDSLEKELHLDALSRPAELAEFDCACVRMEQAFQTLEEKIKNRRS